MRSVYFWIKNKLAQVSFDGLENALCDSLVAIVHSSSAVPALRLRVIV
jgi:hypothetical protein